MSSRRRTLMTHEIAANDFEEVDDNAKLGSNNNRQSDNLNITARSRRLSRAPPPPPPQQNDNNKPRGSITNNIQTTATPAAPPPNNEQLAHLYNNCIKLLNENKINQKNAFSLKLIDYLSDIVLNKEITGLDTNFQVVGCTIDAGSKIYAARVDALHQNTYQMLSGLNNNQDGDNVNDGNNLNQNDDMCNDGDDEANKRKENNKKKRKNKKSTQIVENLDQITTKLNEDFVLDDDLYFSRVSTSIEQEAIEGLLMNKLKLKNDSLNLLINKDDIFFDIDELEQPRQTQLNQSINIKNLCEYASKCELMTSKICEDMSKFRFIGWNVDTNDDITRLCEYINDDLEKDRFDKSSNMIDLHERQQQQLQLQLDFDIGNNSQLGVGGIDDLGEEMDIDLGPMDNSGGPPVLSNTNTSGLSLPPNIAQFDDIRSSKSIADMTTLLQHSINLQSEYSYFNFDKLKLHDLPKHLKAFALKLSNQQKTLDPMQQQQDPQQIQSLQLKDRRKKDAPKLDVSMNIDRSKFLKVTKKAIFLSDRTIENRFDKTYNLETERELDYNARQLLQPYSKQINAKLFSADSAIEEIDNLLIDNNNNNNTNMNRTVIANQTVNAGGDNNLAVNDYYDDDIGPDGGGGIDANFNIPDTIPQTQQFFTQNGGEFNFDTQVPNTQLTSNGMILDGDNLIQAPEQVNALYIEYAKKAKNIDAKKLKQIIWSLVCTSSTFDKENINMNSEDDLINKTNSNSTINCNLRDIYKQLRPPLITQRTFDDLSVSIVFQMLLFLANEHGLRLIHNEDGSDLRIISAL